MGRVRADASQLCGQDRWQQRGTLLGRNGSGGLCGLVAKPVGLNQVAGGVLSPWFRPGLAPVQG